MGRDYAEMPETEQKPAHLMGIALSRRTVYGLLWSGRGLLVISTGHWEHNQNVQSQWRVGYGQREIPLRVLLRMGR